MRCPSCQQENPAGARFCLACGGRLAAACEACGALLPDEARFCPQCGRATAARAGGVRGPSPAAAASPAVAAVPDLTASPTAYTPPHLTAKILSSRAALEGERKPVTVLFCDVAGSTGLAERLGPDAMHDLFNRFFAAALAEVHRYEGTVNQFLGDGFMALFGAPVAHEDHARRAVLAALAIRRAFTDRPLELDTGLPVRLTLRMGLNTGIVVVGAIGDNLRMDYTAVGDTTHLAARLQQLAAPGEILLAGATARLVDGHAALEPCGPTAIRGLQAPVVVHRLTDERPARWSGAPRRRAGFVGRAREVTALEDLLERTRAYGRGHAVGVVGEAGIGKSRLVLELRERTADRPVTWLEGRCVSHGRSIPYLPVLDLLRAQCGVADLDSPEQVAGKVRDTLARLGLEAGDRAPCLLAALGVKDDAEGPPAVDGETLRARTFEALRQLVLRESRERPVVLLVEDLHWADPTSEAYLALVADALAAAPILLLATYRPGYRPPWLGRSWTSQLSLDPLPEADSLAVLRAVAPALHADEARARTVLERAEGNPFFIEELARVVGDEAAARGVGVPDTIQGVVTARIDRLPPRLKHLLQVASVLGREFAPRLLARIVGDEGIGGASLDADLGELARREFVYERVDADEPAWTFKHALTQEGAHATLVAARRRELHHRAAAALEALHPERVAELAPQLADHYAEAAIWPSVLAHAWHAAERARVAYANHEAVARFDQALMAAGRAGAAADQHRALHEARAGVHALLGSFDAAVADLDAALALVEADETGARGRILGSLAALWGGHRDYQRGLDFARQAVDLLAGGNDAGALVEARSRLGIMLINLGRLEEARCQLEDALGLARDRGDLAGQAHVVDILAMCLGQSGEGEVAVRYAEEAVRLLRLIGDREAESSALVTRSFSRMFRGGWREAEDSLDEAIAIADAIGAAAAGAYARGAQGEMAGYFGRLGLALRSGQAALDGARAIGHQEWIINALGALGYALSECGDRAGARLAHEEMVTAARRLGTTIWVSKSLGFLALDLMAAGETERAADCLTEAIEVAGEAVEPMARAWELRVELAFRQEQFEETLALGARARARVGGLGRAPVTRVRAIEADALLALGRVADAEVMLREAREAAVALDLRPVLWRAGLALARLLREGGRQAEARAAAAAALAALVATAAEIEDAALRRSFEATPRFREALAWDRT
jgi:class 3 adenylate cyclase/tetratricopeptide (TPR) repeat protein